MYTHRHGWRMTALLAGIGFLWVGLCLARPQPAASTIRGEVVDEKNSPIPEALCTLTSRLFPTDGLTASTDYKGHFEFNGTATRRVLPDVCRGGPRTAEAHVGGDGRTPARPANGLAAAGGDAPDGGGAREKAGNVSTAANAPSAKLGGAQLANLPLVEQKFKAALPYLPGVVRTPDGRINIKGVPDSQGQLLVNSAEAADPVTGNLAIDVPVVAIDSLQVYKNTYDAQYGGFTGGLTTIHTRPPGRPVGI